MRRFALALALLALGFSASSAGAGRLRLHRTTRQSSPAQGPVSYDTSIGLSVDANGFADLSLRAGAKSFFVNSSTGNDANTCTQAQSAATPKASYSSAASCLTSGEGDHVLIAEGTSYSVAPTGVASGFSAQYPTVIESYDPADPTNAAKYGRASGGNRPIMWTGGSPTEVHFVQGTPSPKYIALRGLDFNPGVVMGLEYKVVGSSNDQTPDYYLFENDLFRYAQFSFDNGLATAKSRKLIIRNCSFFGSFGDHEQGIFLNNIDGTTIEDNVFWHNGWKIVGSSSFTASISGETMTVSAGSNIVTGQLVGATGIDSGTFVTAFGTGTGGAGNYTLGTYQTVSSSTAMTGGTVGSSSFTATVSGRTLNVSVVSSGSIVNGQVITASGLLAGTTITNQQSGTTGQAGKYTIDVPQTISSEAMTGSEDRSMPTDLGGDEFFNHAIYAQTNNVNTIARRNVTVNSALEGANLKGGGILQANLSLRNANTLAEGSGDLNSIEAPFGVYADAGYNAAIGGNIVSPGSGCVYCGVSTVAFRQNFGLIHDNVMANSGNQASSQYALSATTQTDVNGDNITVPNYVTFNHNVSYLWAASGKTTSFNPGNPLVHATATNNIWDDPASGSNVNVGSVSFPNAYTETSLLSALGYPDEATAVNDWATHPEQHKWENGVPLMLAGYGVTKAQMDLAADLRFTAGVAQSGQFIGTLDGYTISATGMPSCMTIDDSSKAWRTDTTCTVGSGTASITETNGTNSHTTSIPWTVYAQPVLSSLSVTPGTTTATINESASVSGGTLYVMVSTVKTTLNSWGYVRANVTDDLEPGTKGAFAANQAVTATGAQPAINATGLTTATAYRVYEVQVDANNNVSPITTFDFTTN